MYVIFFLYVDFRTSQFLATHPYIKHPHPSEILAEFFRPPLYLWTSLMDDCKAKNICIHRYQVNWTY